MKRAHLRPHEEEDGVLTPRRETLALLQGVPKNLTYGDHGTIHVQHMPSLSNGEILKIEEDKGEGKYHMMRIIHPSLFQKADAQIRKEDICKEGKDNFFHTHTHPALCLDVSLHGGIPPGRPPDERKTKVLSTMGNI